MIRFVTGTDTGVGKTVASAVLAARAVASGRRVRYSKPVQTGIAPGAPNADADFVRAVAAVETYELLRFPDPLAPAVAAARAGTAIDVDALVARLRELADACDDLLVEGAGGLLVPLTDRSTMADLAAALGASVIVVARPGLGTLNHTALTLEAATRRGLTVDCVIVSGWPAEPGVTEVTNLDRLRAHGLPIEVIPIRPGLSVDHGETAGLTG